MNRRYLFRALGFFSLLFISACGFHLRGMPADYPGKIASVAVHVQHADPAWEALLRQQFNQANIKVISDLQQAQYTVVILDEQRKNNIVSISSSSSPRQYQLIYQVTFSVSAAHAEFIAPTTLHLNRPITINNDRILGSHDEEEQLTQDIRREAAQQILQRINRRVWSTLIEPATHHKS